MTNLHEQVPMPPSSNIPYGFCHCGCGEKTKISAKGVQRRFLTGHQNRKPRIASTVITISGKEYRTVPLTKGQVAVVDIEDYVELSRHLWYALPTKTQTGWYAARDERRDRKRIHISMHRQLFADSSTEEVDHRDGNGLHNWRDNLRAATHAQNQLNMGKQRNNTSGFKGVYFSKQSGKYIGRVRVSKRYRHVGSFDDPAIAGRAVKMAERVHHGQFARS